MVISAIPIEQKHNQNARELALQRCVLYLLPSWCDECGLERKEVAQLECYLSTHTRELAKQLAGSPCKIESPSLREATLFAICSIPQWGESGFLAPHVAIHLREKLEQQLDASR